jgi:hypothetical protein
LKNRHAEKNNTVNNKKRPVRAILSLLRQIGSDGRDRTYDQLINSYSGCHRKQVVIRCFISPLYNYRFLKSHGKPSIRNQSLQGLIDLQGRWVDEMVRSDLGSSDQEVSGQIDG